MNNDQWRARDLNVLWQQRRELHVYRHGLGRRALLRPLGNVVYITPPCVSADKEIDLLARVAIEGIAIATLAGS